MTKWDVLENGIKIAAFFLFLLLFAWSFLSGHVDWMWAVMLMLMDISLTVNVISMRLRGKK